MAFYFHPQISQSPNVFFFSLKHQTAVHWWCLIRVDRGRFFQKAECEKYVSSSFRLSIDHTDFKYGIRLRAELLIPFVWLQRSQQSGTVGKKNLFCHILVLVMEFSCRFHQCSLIFLFSFLHFTRWNKTGALSTVAFFFTLSFRANWLSACQAYFSDIEFVLWPEICQCHMLVWLFYHPLLVIGNSLNHWCVLLLYYIYIYEITGNVIYDKNELVKLTQWRLTSKWF